MGEVLAILGAFVMLVGAWGLVVLRDPFQRFHSAGKVSVFGLALVILGNAITIGQETGEWSFIAFIGSLILLVSGPFAAHILAKSLYSSKAYKPEAHK